MTHVSIEAARDALQKQAAEQQSRAHIATGMTEKGPTLFAFVSYREEPASYMALSLLYEFMGYPVVVRDKVVPQAASTGHGLVGGGWIDESMPVAILDATFEDRYGSFFGGYKAGSRSWGGVGTRWYILVRLRKTGSVTPEFSLASVSILPYEPYLFGKIQNWYSPVSPPIDRAKRAVVDTDRWLTAFFPHIEILTDSRVLVATKFPYQPHMG